jgi:hypothetical protein
MPRLFRSCEACAHRSGAGALGPDACSALPDGLAPTWVRIFNNRGIDREGVAGLLRPDEFLELLKLDEIKLFLVQVRSLNLATAAKTRNAINEKKQTAPYTSKTSAII